jgi:hypothetical protein
VISFGHGDIVSCGYGLELAPGGLCCNREWSLRPQATPPAFGGEWEGVIDRLSLQADSGHLSAESFARTIRFHCKH